MFFTGLSQLMQDGQTINLNLLKKGDKLFVCLMPKVQNMPESAMSKLIPLNVEGTPTELDQAFLETISLPVQERFGLISNVDAFRDNTKSTGSKNSSGTNNNQAGGQDSKEAKIARRTEEAEKFEKAQRWPEAYAIYKKLSEADPTNRKKKEKAVEVWAKMSQKPLFTLDTDAVTVETGGVTLHAEEVETDESKISTSNTPIIKPEDETQRLETTNQHISMNQTQIKKEEAPVDMFAQIMGMANSQV